MLAPLQLSRMENRLERGIARNVRNFTNQFGQQAYRTEQQVAESNATIENRNGKVRPVLAETTGQDFSSPSEWWTWWKDYNGYESSQERPVYSYAYNDDRSYSVPTPVTVAGGRSCECFTRGTPIWTKAGLRPIESLKMGDLVLAQDVETGELAYKPIVGTTVRPPSPVVRLTIDEEQITATVGHPFWVAGKGWRMARELTDGVLLHGVKSPSSLLAVATADEATTYNLVVADFATYFVGRCGVLVHDNSLNRSTLAAVPGFAREEQQQQQQQQQSSRPGLEIVVGR